MEIERKREHIGKKRKILMISVTAVSFIAFAALLFAFMFGSASFFTPTILNKDSFTAEEKAVIASELDIPAEDLTVKNMRLTHARETYICITVAARSLDILSSYEYSGGSNYDDHIRYLKKGGGVHDTVKCTVRSEQPLELDFELSDTWNNNLRNIMLDQ